MNPDANSTHQAARSALHDQLPERLRADSIRGGQRPEPRRSRDIVRPRRAVRRRGVPHRHVAPVVVADGDAPRQCPELDMARELCAYGERLTRHVGRVNDPPFENTYADYKCCSTYWTAPTSRPGSTISARSGRPPPRAPVPGRGVGEPAAEGGPQVRSLAVAGIPRRRERQLSCPGVTSWASRSATSPACPRQRRRGRPGELPRRADRQPRCRGEVSEFGLIP